MATYLINHLRIPNGFRSSPPSVLEFIRVS